MPKPDLVFQKEYLKLNTNQKVAVNTITGPVMVIAGPGTGKTQVLTMRIANILKKTDSPPDSILALTFTDAAAKEMKTRLLNLIGEDAYFVNITTFHAFCQSVISENPDKFIISEETKHLSELERIQIFEELLINHDFKYIKPPKSPFYYLKSLTDAIKNLKREGISPKDLKTVLKKNKNEFKTEKKDLSKTKKIETEKNLNKNEELQRIYLFYQKELVKRGRFDFEDMINLVVDKFKSDQDLLLSYQEKLSHILVDEYQDTNSAQNQLIFNLSSFWGDQANLFVVGDPHQSIFRFQGASLENTKEFLSRFPVATLINLDQNYRSTQLILDTIHASISHNQNNFPASKNISLKSNSKLKNNSLQISNFANSLHEDFFVAQDIQKQIQKGTSPQDIAIIARENKSLSSFVTLFTKLNIPFTISGGENILEDPLIKQFLLLLNVIQNTPQHHSDTELFILLNFQFLNIKSFDILKTAKLASSSRTHIVDYVLSNNPLNTISKSIKDFFKNLSFWQKEAANKTLLEFFQFISQQSGFLDFILAQPSSVVSLNKLNSLFTEAKSMSYQNPDLNLESFLNNLETMKRQNIIIPNKSLPVENNSAITLTTTHKAKGLEWQHVYLIHCTDGKWGNPKKKRLLKLPPQLLKFGEDENDPNQEERRLFYVALSRSKKDLTVTSSSQYLTSYGSQSAFPSMFIKEIPKKYKKETTPKLNQSKVKKILSLNLAHQPSPVTSLNEKKYLTQIIKDFKLSPTSLNSYLDCPYKFKLNNLYRLPRAKEAHLAFGTAIHKALEMFYQKFEKDQKLPFRKYLLQEFKVALKKEVITPKDFKRLHNHGQEVLSSYYNFHQTKLTIPLSNEKSFGNSPYSKCQLGDISLNGKVDRIELLNKKENTVKVVDYKTGNPKTKGEIEGTTKNSKGHLKRQLVFYHLLSQLDKNFSYQVKKTELDFIESPHKNQKTGQTSYQIKEKDIKILKKEIKNTMNKIRNLNFKKTTDHSLCSNYNFSCEFKDHCWPNGVPQSNAKKSI